MFGVGKISGKIHSFMKKADGFGITEKKDRIRALFDFLYCRTRFHVTLEEYLLYDFYRYKNSYRKYFLTAYQRRHSFRYVNKVWHTKSKMFMYGRMKELYGREIFSVSDHTAREFGDFVGKHGKVFIKPDKASCGRGTEIFSYTTDSACREKYDELAGRDMICEEVISQHHALEELCPSSVNSCRILTLLDHGEVNLIAATIKMSKGEAFVDNLHANGIGAAVDTETGIVTTVGRDYLNRTYIEHPLTGRIIPGFRLPFWKETVELVKKAHPLMPESAVIGWDVAFTENGPVLLEANGAPGPNIHQFADKEPKGRTIMSYIAKKENRAYDPKINRYPEK